MNITNTSSTGIRPPNGPGRNSQIPAGDSFFPDLFPLESDTFNLQSATIAKGAPPTDELNQNSPLKPSRVEKTPVKQTVTPKVPFTFRDFIDVINPLQHIPIISTIYRSITHDEIKAPARILGGGLFGGLVGAAVGLINSLFSKVTGKDMGEHMADLFKTNDAIAAQNKTHQNGEGIKELRASAPRSVPDASMAPARSHPDAPVETAEKFQLALENHIEQIPPPDGITAPPLNSIPFEQLFARAAYHRIAAQVHISNRGKELMGSTLDLYH